MSEKNGQSILQPNVSHLKCSFYQKHFFKVLHNSCLAIKNVVLPDIYLFSSCLEDFKNSCKKLPW